MNSYNSKIAFIRCYCCTAQFLRQCMPDGYLRACDSVLCATLIFCVLVYWQVWYGFTAYSHPCVRQACWLAASRHVKRNQEGGECECAESSWDFCFVFRVVMGVGFVCG